MRNKDAELARREDEMNQFVEAVVKAQEAVRCRIVMIS